MKKALWPLERSLLVRVALSCVVAGCGAEKRNSGAETELALQQQPATETPPPAPEPAKVKVFNVAPGRFVLEANAPIKVATDGALERRSDDGSWSSVPFKLRRGCEAAAGAETSQCIDILPGQPYVALSWNGDDCRPCCYSDRPVFLVPGVYRLAPRACGGESGGWEGPTFEVPQSRLVFQSGNPLPPSNFDLERLRAAANVESGSVFKLERPGPRDAIEKVPVDPAMIVGRPIVPGSEAPLSPELVSRLEEWIGNPTGFNNVFMRRCSWSDRYGFRLTRNVPHVGREVTELAIELSCNTIAIVNQEGTLRPEVYTYFDESRAELLALLREAVLPSFREAIPNR